MSNTSDNIVAGAIILGALGLAAYSIREARKADKAAREATRTRCSSGCRVAIANTLVCRRRRHLAKGHERAVRTSRTNPLRVCYT